MRQHAVQRSALMLRFEYDGYFPCSAKKNLPVGYDDKTGGIVVRIVDSLRKDLQPVSLCRIL